MGVSTVFNSSLNRDRYQYFWLLTFLSGHDFINMVIYSCQEILDISRLSANNERCLSRPIKISETIKAQWDFQDFLEILDFKALQDFSNSLTKLPILSSRLWFTLRDQPQHVKSNFKFSVSVLTGLRPPCIDYLLGWLKN